MLNVTLFTRNNSPEGEQVRAELQNLQEKFPHRLVEVDVDSDPVLLAKYGSQVPVVEVGAYSLKAPISPQSLQMTVGAAFDRRNQLEQVGDPKYQARVAKGADDPYTRYYVACVHALRGDFERALDSLERVWAALPALTAARIRRDPDLDSVRDHPRFIALTRSA